MHHALLITGKRGSGKRAFAEAIARKFLCERPSSPVEDPCDECDSCRWFLAGNHPDMRLLAPEPIEESAADSGGSAQAGTVIKIDQVRELDDFVYIGSHRGGRRVVLVAPAEAMNAAAANALLKMLEEPPANVHFILVSERWRRLLPTLRSRCRRIVLQGPSRADGEAWLRGHGVGADAAILLDASGGEVLTALEWANSGRSAVYRAELDHLAANREDPLALSARWEAEQRAGRGLTLEGLVDLLQKWVFDLVCVRLSQAPRFYPTMQTALAQLAAGASLGRLLRCYNELLEIRAVSSHPLNARLALEDLASRYLRSLRSEAS